MMPSVLKARCVRCRATYPVGSTVLDLTNIACGSNVDSLANMPEELMFGSFFAHGALCTVCAHYKHSNVSKSPLSYVLTPERLTVLFDQQQKRLEQGARQSEEFRAMGGRTIVGSGGEIPVMLVRLPSSPDVPHDADSSVRSWRRQDEWAFAESDEADALTTNRSFAVSPGQGAPAVLFFEEDEDLLQMHEYADESAYITAMTLIGLKQKAS